jgi:hypothetical protein
MNTRAQRAPVLALFDELASDMEDAIQLLAGYVDSRDTEDGQVANDAMTAVGILERAVRKAREVTS